MPYSRSKGKRRKLVIALVALALAAQGCFSTPTQATREVAKPRILATPTIVPPCGAVNWLAKAKVLATKALSDHKVVFQDEFMDETIEVVDNLKADPSCYEQAMNLQRGVFLLNWKRLEELK